MFIAYCVCCEREITAKDKAEFRKSGHVEIEDRDTAKKKYGIQLPPLVVQKSGTITHATFTKKSIKRPRQNLEVLRRGHKPRVPVALSYAMKVSDGS